jgi:DNA topoisomerase IA
MMVAQHLYENGLITYMRTDSVNLSKLCIGATKEEILKEYGEEYLHTRNFQTKSKGAQEAHEAIRPTYMNQAKIEGTVQERRLYDLIRKRTIASQMADALIEKTQVNISVSGATEQFIVQGEVVKFDGFMKVYAESRDDDNEQENMAKLQDNAREMLNHLVEAFNGISEWSGEAAFQVIKPLAKANGVKVGAMMFPLRMALTGTHAGPGIDVIMQVLGRDEVLRRISVFPC